MPEQQRDFSGSIARLAPTDKRWLSFLVDNDQAGIFHHPAWSQVLAECYGYRSFVCSVLDDKGAIKAGVPVMEIRSSLTGRRWVALPFSDHCRPLFDDEESLARLTDYFAEAYSAQTIPSIELNWEYPSRSLIQFYSDHVLQTIDLLPDAGEVFSRIKPKYRRTVRIAEREGVHVEWGDTYEHLDAFYELHLLTRRRLGVPIQPRKFFRLLWENVLKRDLGFLLLAYKDGLCLAGAIFLHWRKTVTYKYSASSGVDRKLGATDCILWKAIDWACDNGYTSLDLGRTARSNEGLRFYKKRWRSEEVPLVYSYLGRKPTQPPGGKLMSIMQTVIRHSPTWVCRVAGEVLYRHFG